MANKYLLEREKTIKREIEKRAEALVKEKLEDFEAQAKVVVPVIYSSVALALKNCYSEITDEEIAMIFDESQILWNEHKGNLEEMLDKCNELTGIDVRGM